MSRSSIASVAPEAGFDIGSYLASVNSQQSAVLNTLLGTLGGTATVSLLGYQGLANTSVTVNQLITASGGLLTPSNVMTTSLPGSQWQAIWSDAVANQVAQVNCSSSPTPPPAQPAPGFTRAGRQRVDVSFALSAGNDQQFDVHGNLSTLSTAELRPVSMCSRCSPPRPRWQTGQALDLGTSLGITGVSDATLTSSAWARSPSGLRALGTTASTAQLTADLQLNDLGVGIIDIPLSAAQGTATLTTLSCRVQLHDRHRHPTDDYGCHRHHQRCRGRRRLGLSVGSQQHDDERRSVMADRRATDGHHGRDETNPQMVGTTTPNLTTGSLVLGTLSGSVLNGVVGPSSKRLGSLWAAPK